MACSSRLKIRGTILKFNKKKTTKPHKETKAILGYFAEIKVVGLHGLQLPASLFWQMH
jgi:hypothetical protein